MKVVLACILIVLATSSDRVNQHSDKFSQLSDSSNQHSDKSS